MREEVIGECRLILGDCLDVLPELDEADAVIADPPYCSGARTTAEVSGRGGMSRGQLWKSRPMDNDRMTTTGFSWLMRQVGCEAERLLKQGGSFLSFIDWRQYPTLYGCLEACNLRIQGMVVWDKEDMALGNGFRNQHELIIHAAKGTPAVYDRSIPNVLRCKRISQSEIHPTEKPAALYEALVRVVSPRAGLVADPFMGSGTCGVACARLGRRFVGIERDPKHFAAACRRIEAAYGQGDLFRAPPPPKPVQVNLLDGAA
jgi:site-specific DNA-methyltransferase (adenine-specific)